MAAGLVYEWREWRYEPTELRLMRKGEIVSLPGKTLDVLHMLLRHAPRLITKEEMLAAVWPDAAVEEGNIAFHVAALRKVLDPVEGPSPIETVRGRGYRFVDTVTIDQKQQTDTIGEPLSEPASITMPASVSVRPVSVPEPSEPSPFDSRALAQGRPLVGAQGKSRMVPAPLIMIVVAAVVAGAWWQLQPQAAPIAVQPFEIVNPPKGQENFSDGLVTYLTVNLRQAGITIVPGESASAVLTGQLHPIANGFRVAVQLTAGRDGARLWDWSFDVSFDDERPPAGAGPDDARSRVQGLIASRVSEGLKSYVTLQ